LCEYRGGGDGRGQVGLTNLIGGASSGEASGLRAINLRSLPVALWSNSLPAGFNSLIGRFSSLFGRFDSLFGGLGNGPKADNKNNELATLPGVEQRRERVFACIFPSIRE
jgi:hypothetical protein